VRKLFFTKLLIIALAFSGGRAVAQTTCDSDGDGHLSVACGGDDCDDTDSVRYPGNLERCAGRLIGGRRAAKHDEDCNPCTVQGSRPDGDSDWDLVPAASCVNTWGASTPSSGPSGCDLNLVRLDPEQRRTLGADCDDKLRAIVPGSQSCMEDPKLIRVCLASGVAGSGKNASDWDIQKCVGHCEPQPNGTGVCMD
jgi:hypothetical protein